MNKKYIIEVATNPASLKKLRDDLQEATRLPKEGVEIPELSRETKARVKKDLATLFGVADYQADALRNMVQAMTQGLTDSSSVENMKNQLEQTLQFANDIMEAMQKMGKGTDWMKQGVGFIDDFIKMKESIETVEGLEKSVANLTQTFEVFKDALAETNMDAFLQRFGNSTKAEAAILAKANKELQRVAKLRNTELSNIISNAKGSDDDFEGDTREDIEEYYKTTIQAIQKYLKEIDALEHQYQGRTKALYKDTKYKDLLAKLAADISYIESMPGLNTDDIGKNLKASLQEATDSVKNAKNEIQNIVDGLKGTGIELAITLPDPTTAEFAAEINKFVKKANAEFKDHPIEMTLDVASPFKKDAFKKDGTLKELSSKQKELSQGIEKTFRENLQKENLEIGEDDLEGLYNVNTNVIARNIADAFNKLYKSMTTGQALIKSATKKWRDAIEEDLTVKPKFDIEGAKTSLDTEMGQLQDEFEANPERWLPIHADVDGLTDEIQNELNEKIFNVTIKANDIEGGNIVVTADQIRLGAAPQVNGGQMPVLPQNAKPKTPPTPTKEEESSKPVEPVKVESPKQTKAITENSTALREGTKVQAVLTSLLNELKNAQKINEGRDEMSEKAIKDARAKAEKNADAITEREKSVASTNKEWKKVGDERRELEKDIERETQSRDHIKDIRGNIEKKFYDLLKAGDFDKLNQEFSQYMEMLPKAREELKEAIKKVNESNYSDDTKHSRVSKYDSQIRLIDRLLDKDNPLSITDKTDSGRRAIYEAIDAIYTHQIDEIQDKINGLNKQVQDKTRLIGNLSQSSGRSLLAINELEHAGEIESKEKSIEKRSKEQSVLAARINKINKVLDGDKDPVNLIWDEVNSFWKAYTKNAVEAKKYIETKNAELQALEDSVRGKNLDKNSKEYKEYQRKRATILEEKAYVDAKKKYDKWEPRRAAMAAAGFDIRGMAEAEALDYLRNLLKNNPSLHTRLMDNDADLKIRSIEDLAYFIKPVQETLGVKPRTENEYMSEQELQAAFKEALKIADYIAKAKGVINNIDGDLNPKAVQDFINYFEHIPGMADAVENARRYLENAKDIPEAMWDDVDPKTFLDQFKDFWSAMDNAAKSEFLGALNQTHVFDDKNPITSVDNVDNWDGRFNDVLAGYREEASKLRLLGEETNNPQLQQILNVLERSTLLNQTRDAANKYGERGIISALFGMQNSKLAGNNMVPQTPIHMTARSKKGKTKVYTIGNPGSKKGVDKSFAWSPEQLQRAFTFANVTTEIEEIIQALRNDALVGQEDLQNKIRELNAELNVLDGLGKITTTDKEERKKQLDKFSYHSFDGTDLEHQWHGKKNIEADIESINEVLAAKLNMQVFPDKLFNEMKGLRDQKRLEREIRELKDGDYSSVGDAFKGLTQKEIGERVRNLVSAKQQELEVIKAQNTVDLEELLAKKIDELSNLENRIIENSQKVIAAKQQELAATQEALNQLKPIAERAQQEVDTLLNKLFSSGKLKLSQGADADESPWAGKYKYQDSELAKHENRQEANKREKERLKSQIAKLESGDYDDETKALLATNLAKEEEKARERQANLRQQIQNLETRIANIDKEVKDGKLKEEDGKKQKEDAITSLEKARTDLATLEQKMQSGELKVEIEQVQQAYVQQLINNLKTALTALEQDSVAMDDVIKSILALEDDMQLSKEKATHERVQAKGKEKQVKNLQGKIKRGNVYGNARDRYKSAIYREAYAEHKNEEIAKYGITSSEKSVAKVDNLLRRIQFAKTHGLMDTKELEQMVIEYERLDKKYHDTEDLKALGKATEEDINKAFEELRKYRLALVDKFFNTEGWFKTTRLETLFSEKDGEAREEIEKKRNESNPAKDKVSAQRKAVEAKEQQDKNAVEQYTDLLYQEYIEKPKQEIREALKQEVEAMRSASSDNKARKDAVDQNIENDPRYKEAYKKLEIEQESDPKLAALKKRKRELQQPRDELINNPEYQELLRTYEELKEKKLLGTDLAKEVRAKIIKGYKNIGADGKNTQEYIDIENAIKEIEQAYRARFNRIRDQLIAEEKKKIDAELIPDSAYSKYSVDIKTAMDNRDAAIARLQDEAKDEVKIFEELSGNEKYKPLLQEYDKLKQQGKEGSDGYKNVLAKMRGAWIEEQTKKINEAFDTFVNSVVEELFEKSGAKQDYKTSLGDRKKEVIDRLMDKNTDFANLVESIKNEKGIDAISAKGKNKTLDYFKLSKELMARGIPDGLIDTRDLAVIADQGIRKSDDLGKHLNKLKELLFKKIKGIITNAMGQINDADIPSDSEIEQEVGIIKKSAEIAKKAAIEDNKDKTDRELLAEEYSDAQAAHEKQAKAYDDRYEEDKEKRDKILQAHPEITEDVLKAARAGTLLHQEVAAEEQRTAEAIKEGNAAVESRKSGSTPTSIPKDGTSVPGGYYHGGYSYGGIIDTSDLAKEGTLRGIYEVLNGGAPKGGWDDSISESSKTHGSNYGDVGLSDYDDVFRTFTYDEIEKMVQPEIDETVVQQASTQVANNIMEAGTQAAIEESKEQVKKQKSKGKLTTEEKTEAEKIVDTSKINATSKADFWRQNQKTGIEADNTIESLERRKLELQKSLSDLDSGAYTYNGKSEVIDFLVNQYADSDLGILKEKQRKTKSENKKNEYQQYIDAVLNQYRTILTEKIREYLESELQSVETNLSAINTQVDDTRNPVVQQTTSQVAEAIVEAGAQAAVDPTKNINTDLHGFDPGNKGILNTLRRTKKGNDLTNAEIVEKYLKDGFIPYKSDNGEIIELQHSIGNDAIETLNISNAQYEYAKYLQSIAKSLEPATVSTEPIQAAVSKVAEAIVENAGEAASQAVETGSDATQASSIGDLSSIYDDILSKFGFEKLSKDKVKAIKDQSLQYIDNEINGQEFDDVFTNDDGKIKVVSDELYKISDMREKIINSILEALEETAMMTGDMNTYASSEDDIRQYLDSVLPRVTSAIIESASDSALAAANSETPATGKIDTGDLSTVFSKVFERFNFSWISDELAREMQNFATELLKGKINEGFVSDILKITDDGRITALSDDAFNNKDIKKKIVDELVHDLKLAFDNLNEHPLYDMDSDDIAKYVREILPGGKTGQKKKTVKKDSTPIPTPAPVVDDKDVKNANAVADAAERQAQASAEVAQQGAKATESAAQHAVAENAITQAMENQVQASVKTKLTKESVDSATSHLDTFTRTKRSGEVVKQTGVSRAKDGLANVYSVLSKNETKLTDKNLNKLQIGYRQLVDTIKHAIFNQLDEQTQQLLIQAKDEALDTLNKNGINVDVGSNISSSNAGGSGGGNNNSNTQGGILGILSRLATEATLKSILAQLSKGVKTSSNGEGSTRGTKKSDKDTKTLTKEKATNKLKEYLETNYKDSGYDLSAVKTTASGYAIDVTRQKDNTQAIEDARKALEECKAGTEEWFAAQKKLNMLQAEQEKIVVRINAENGNITATSSFKNLAVGAKAATKELQNVDNIMQELHSAGMLSFDDDGNISASNQSVIKYIDSLKLLQDYIDNHSQEELYSSVNQQPLSDLTLNVQNYRKEIMSLMKDISQLNVGTKIDTEKLLGGIDGLSDGNIKQLMQEIISESNNLEKTFGKLTPITNEFDEVIGYKLAYTVRTGKHEVQEMTAVLNPLTNELRVQKGAVKEVATGWQQFFNGLKGKAASIMQYLISITSIHDVFRYMREGLQYVRDIDSALTELKKVTDETDASYAKFLQDMSKTGSVIGATVSNLTTMAAEWSRLGFSMEEAGRLAESTAILLNVSEFEDATTASEALISTMQAFQYTADESQHVVDILNEVGKFIARR